MGALISVPVGYERENGPVFWLDTGESMVSCLGNDGGLRQSDFTGEASCSTLPFGRLKTLDLLGPIAGNS
jgi:hypothetical protein